MNAEELKSKVSSLKIWKKGDKRAPHKPLLILYALSRLQNEKAQMLPYEEVKGKLTELLKDFGPATKSYSPENPFCRLARDGIWTHNTNSENIRINDKWLLNNRVVGGFNDQIYSLLANNKNLIREVAEIVLDQHFQPTLHEDILMAVGLNIEIIQGK